MYRGGRLGGKHVEVSADAVVTPATDPRLAAYARIMRVVQDRLVERGRAVPDERNRGRFTSWTVWMPATARAYEEVASLRAAQQSTGKSCIRERVQHALPDDRSREAFMSKDSSEVKKAWERARIDLRATVVVTSALFTPHHLFFAGSVEHALCLFDRVWRLAPTAGAAERYEADDDTPFGARDRQQLSELIARFNADELAKQGGRSLEDQLALLAATPVDEANRGLPPPGWLVQLRSSAMMTNLRRARGRDNRLQQRTGVVDLPLPPTRNQR